MWWNQYGPFEAEGNYPQPRQVIAHYRQQAELSKERLATRLHISVRALYYLEQDSSSLDSIARRREICELLQIPPALLGLCSKPGDNWWMSDYEQWPAGSDGWPHTGAVIKSYRRAKSWTQAQLAEALGITILGVGKMERSNSGLDSITRRRAVRFILNIPPILLGLDNMHIANAATTAIRAARSTLALPTLDELRQAQGTLWSGYYNGHGLDVLEGMGNTLTHLPYALNAIPEAQRSDYLEQVSLLYQGAGNVVLATANTQRVTEYMQQGIKYARLSGDNDLLSTALGRTSAALLELGDQQQAERLIREALTVASPSEVVKRYPVASRVLSVSALDQQDRGEVLSMIDKIVINDRYQNGVDPNIILWCRAKVLLNIVQHAPDRSRLLRQASELLDQAERGAPDVPRRMLIIKMAQARAALGLREYDYAATLALEAIALMKKIKSVLYFPQFAEMYNTLMQSSYADEPLTARLGLELFVAGAL